MLRGRIVKGGRRICTMTATLNLPERASFLDLDLPALIHRLRVGIECFDRRLFDLDHEIADRAFGSEPEAGVGAWSCRATLGHIFDVEVLWAYRIRRVVAEESPVLEDFDHEAFIASPLSGGSGENAVLMPPGAMAACIHTLRQTTAAMLYQFPQDAGGPWLRRGMHPNFGAMTLRELIATQVWHLEHHASFINAKLELLLGPAPDPATCEEHAATAGGCGSGCACAAERSGAGEGGDGSGSGA